MKGECKSKYVCRFRSRNLNGRMGCCCSVMSNSLRPYELQHTKRPCPTLSPGVYSDSCSMSWWCHPTTSVCSSNHEQHEKTGLRIFKFISVQNSSYGYPEISEAGFLTRGIALAERSLNSEQLYQVILIFWLRFFLLFKNVIQFFHFIFLKFNLILQITTTIIIIMLTISFPYIFSSWHFGQ